MSKIIKFSSQVTEKLLSGVEKTTEIVSKTMGPVASNIIICENNIPRVTKDGITVLRSVEFDDELENIAAQMIREASDKTNSESGDGTTGTAILLNSIFKNGITLTSLGNNKIQIRNGIKKAANKAVEFIKKASKQISTKEDIRNVAKISSNQSDEIADVLTNVFEKIGTRGVIKVETGNTTETYCKIVDGCQYDVGYISPFFCTNEKMEADLDNPFTLFCDKKLSNIQEMIPMLDAVSKTGKPLFIMCEDMDGEALQTIVMNRLRGFPVCVVKAPSYGENKKSILQDLGILTNSQVVSEETGIKIENALPGTNILGQAKRIIVTKDNTTIIGCSAAKEDIAKRVNQLDMLIENSTDEFDKGKLEDRRAKLDGGVAVVYVGGRTELELKEKRDLVDDAFNSVKVALKNGIVPGGGLALLNVYRQFNNWYENNLIPDLVGDEKLGVNIFCNSLLAPIKMIITNAGENADLITAKLLENKDESIGYDVLNKKFLNLLDNGIVDPASVIISEIENASSIAGLMLTTIGAIATKNIQENKTHQCCH